MPPKKQQEEASSYKGCFILPIFAGNQMYAPEALKKTVNIKKNIDQTKIIQILKQKGLAQHISENGDITAQGRTFIGENMKVVADQVINMFSKPADPKKDAKKDTKKDSKKQQVVEETQPPLEFSFNKNCNDFYFYLDYPQSTGQLQLMLKSQSRIDIIVLINDQIKPGSMKPDFTLLNNQKTIEDLQHTLNGTISSPSSNSNNKQNQIRANEMCKKYIANKSNTYRNTLVIQFPFLKNLSNPQQDFQFFLKTLFEKLCSCTLEEEKYQSWKNQRKIVNMVEPLKETVKKQVQVESNDKGKKGGKGQPVFQTVQEVVETRYEDIPEHIRSDLKKYHIIKNTLNFKQQNQIDPQTDSIYNDILSSCLMSICSNQQNNSNKAEQIEKLAQKIKNNYQIKPINKSTPQTLSMNIRKIVYHKDMSMLNEIKFNYPIIEDEISFMDLAHKANTDRQSLQIEYIIKKMQDLIKNQCPKLKWDFSDRQFIEKFSADRMKSILNKQILRDPQIFTCLLETEGIKIIIMSSMNPPGRVLHHNTIMDWKVIPDYQNWTNYFLTNPQKNQIQDFFPYTCEEAGNLWIKSKSMMPTDNSIIRDEQWNIGSKIQNIIKIEKNDANFGMVKMKVQEKQKYLYWHTIGQNFSLKNFKKSILKRQINKKEEQIDQKQGQQNNQNKEGQQKQQKQEQQVNQKLIQEQFVESWISKKQSYLMKINKQVEIIWQNNNSEQKFRRFSSMGQITSYHKDGSIHIYQPNGDISLFKNGRWTRVVDNYRVLSSTEKQQMQIEEILEGETLIKIRDDQTIFVNLSNGDYKTIFPDGTQIYHNHKKNRRDIKSPFNQSPIIRITLPRSSDYTLIGQGSAFAYLGFTNILQRSYDGYLLEVIDKQFAINEYLERFDKNGVILEQTVRLISHQDSSLFKINVDSATIVYNSPNPQKVLTSEYLNERWLQAFTPPKHHQQMESGIFDIDLNGGQIENKDAESNKFLVKVDGKTQVNIAVSFVSVEENEGKQSFDHQNGFHVKQQNYFLPPPNNSNPPRLFTLLSDGSGVQYLNSEQLGQMEGYVIHEEYRGNKCIKQYSRQLKENTPYISFKCMQPVNVEIFGLPDPLKSIQTHQALIPISFCGLKHRVIEQIPWQAGFPIIKGLSQKILSTRQIKIEKLGTLKRM